MWIDVIALMFIGLMAYFGWRQGILKQIFSIISVLLAVFLARHMVGLVQNTIHLNYFPCLVISAVLIFVVAKLVFWSANSSLGKSENEEVKSWNRTLGLVLGMSKGLLLVWATSCVSLALLAHLPDSAAPSFHKSLQGSLVGRVASATNPLGFVGRFIGLLREVYNDPQKRAAFLNDPNMREFVNDPEVQKFLEAPFREKLNIINRDMIRKAKSLNVLEALERAKRGGRS